MKRLFFAMTFIGLLFLSTPAFAWNLFFIAQQEVVGQANGEDIYGYKLGPDDLIVLPAQVTELQNVGATYLFLYITNSNALANQVKDWSEFRGFGYTDMVMRIAQGLSNGTLNEIEYVTGARWFVGGEWHFGNVKDWKAAGSPAQVVFGRYRGIYGVDIE